MPPEERLEVLFVDEAVAPVINFLESFLIVELLAALHGLLEVLCYSVESYFLLKQSGKGVFYVRTQYLWLRHFKAGSLCNLSSQVLIVAGHNNLQEVIEEEHSITPAIKVLDNCIAVRFVSLINSILPEEAKQIYTRDKVVFVPVYSLESSMRLELWKSCKCLPLLFDDLFPLPDSEYELLEQEHLVKGQFIASFDDARAWAVIFTSLL